MALKTNHVLVGVCFYTYEHTASRDFKENVKLGCKRKQGGMEGKGIGVDFIKSILLMRDILRE